MNTFTAWNIPKQPAAEEKFDPTFLRQDSLAHDDSFSVADVTARAVANALLDPQPDALLDRLLALPIGPQQIQQLQLGSYDDQHPPRPSSDAGSRSPDLLNDESSKLRVRSVSSLKRAAQNRNAQRAFRQRKEKYIKELELRAAEAEDLRKTLNDMRQENMQLRDYTLVLQSRVIELTEGKDKEKRNDSNQN